MAKVLQDPRERPDVILGDFTIDDPLVTFTPEDVVFTYGSKWKQRYYTRIGDDYFIFPAQWTCRTGSGAATSPDGAATGGPSTTQKTRCNVPPARCATGVIR